MASLTTPAVETMADLLAQLHVPPERILLRPPPGKASEKHLLKTPRLCELIDGVLVEKSMGFYESRLAVVLGSILDSFAEKKQFGHRAWGGRPHARKCRTSPHTGRRVLFLESIPGQTPSRRANPRFGSRAGGRDPQPDQHQKEMQRKRREYFAGGAQLVWEVEPKTKEGRVFTGVSESETVGEDASLDGGDVLPGFSLSIREWFERAGRRG